MTNMAFEVVPWVTVPEKKKPVQIKISFFKLLSDHSQWHAGEDNLSRTLKASGLSKMRVSVNVTNSTSSIVFPIVFSHCDYQ